VSVAMERRSSTGNGMFRSLAEGSSLSGGWCGREQASYEDGDLDRGREAAKGRGELEADSSPATDLTSQITGRRRIVRGGESLPPSMLLFMDFSSWLSYVASPH
jgi:hypothetical protein